MNDTAIKVEHLSKMYRLGVINNGTLWKDLQSWFALRMGKEDPHSIIGEEAYSGDNDHFWALKDINLEILAGDRVGIIGKNGAGKSTLLKILSRITGPTEGAIRVRGKVASLLEVGTGFNGELTGRENVYLNGAILGMKSRQIDRKLDEIIAFSGIEHHIDTPVKRYSSGMFVRLGFAVAAHLDSDILIADEVLAVGDAEFQKKALGKMQDLSTGFGRTVLFVSHNIASVKALCNRGILLERGRITARGTVEQVAELYLSENQKDIGFVPFSVPEIGIEVVSLELNRDLDGKIESQGPLRIDIGLKARQDVVGIAFQFMISHKDTSGSLVSLSTKETDDIDMNIKKGWNSVTCHIESFDMCSGSYWLGLGIALPFVKFYHHDRLTLPFKVNEVIKAPRLVSSAPDYGHVYLKHHWEIS